MKKISLVVLTLATALATASAATLDTLTFTATGTNNGDPKGTASTVLQTNASGTLTGIALGGGEFGIISASNVSITFDGTAYSATFVPSGSEWGSDVTTLPLAGYYTDIVDTTGASGDLPNNVDDIGGIVFQSTSAGTYVNDYVFIFNDGNGDVTYVSSISGLTVDPPYPASNGYEVNYSDSVVTPEPSSLLLMGTGLLLMAGFLFRKAKPSMNRAA